MAVSEQEKKEGFKALFNGVNLDGWAFRNPKGLKSWSAQNGMLVNDLKSRIRKSGPLPFSDFIETCIDDHQKGFITKKGRA